VTRVSQTISEEFFQGELVVLATSLGNFDDNVSTHAHQVYAGEQVGRCLKPGRTKGSARFARKGNARACRYSTAKSDGCK